MTPVRAVIIPALQAALTGFFSAFLTFGLLVFFQYPTWMGTGALTLIATGMVTLIAWAVLLDKQYKLLAPPEPVRMQAFQLTTISDMGRAGTIANLPGGVDQFSEFCRRALQQGLSATYHTGSHGEYTKGEYARLTAELLRRNWITRRGGSTAGYEFTPQGRAVVRHMASPLPRRAGSVSIAPLERGRERGRG